MKAIYNVIHKIQHNLSGNLSKEFNSHEDALQYITDMLKYHDASFEIQKLYTRGEK